MHLVYRWLELSLNLTEQRILLVQRFLLGYDNKKEKEKKFHVSRRKVLVDK